jgi:hypothetical protein
MAKRNETISIKLHNSFYNRILEPGRRKMEKSMGLNNLPMTTYTSFLASSGASIKSPRINLNKFQFKKQMKRGFRLI